MIKTLNNLKAVIAYERLYCALMHEDQTNWLKKLPYSNQLSEICVVETKVVVLQQRLSHLVSQACSFLVEWDTISEEEKIQWQMYVKEIAKAIKLSPNIEAFFDRHLLHRRDVTVYPSLPIEAFQDCFEHYLGVKISKDQKIPSLVHLKQCIATIAAADFTSPVSINQVVAIIGREEAFDFRHAVSTVFFRGRLN
jgi:hypothetical protein